MTEQPQPQENFTIDAFCTNDRLAEYAAQMEQIPEDRQKRLEELMNNTGSKEFYKGLMAGYAASAILLRQIPAANITLEIDIVAAFLAAKLRKMKSIDLPGGSR